MQANETSIETGTQVWKRRSSRRAGRRLARFCAVTLAALALGFAVSRASAAEGALPFSLTPQPSEAAEGYFVLEADPGEDVDQYVVIRNTSTREITVALAGVDGGAAALGGVSYGLPTDAPQGVGAWIDLVHTQVTLKPDEAAKVPFTVSIPATATSGDHIGGISAWVPADVTTKSTAKTTKFGANIKVQTRRVVAVRVICPGTREALLAINGVTPIVRPDGVYLSVGIENQGTALTTGTVELEVVQDEYSKKASFDTIIPGVTLAYPMKWMVDPRKGTYDATARVHYADGSTASWEGTFRIGAEEIAVLRDRLVVETMPWWRENLVLLIAGALVALLVLGGIIAAVRRSRRPPA